MISLPRWFRNIGLAGFFFFLAKGLVWTAVFAFVAFKGCAE